MTRPLAKKLTGRSVVRTNADRFIGMIGEVTREVPNDGSRGEVKVNGTSWGAFTTQKESIPAGSKVVVQDIVGNKLLVAPISEKEI
jgi:membrane protein implicated in regulation of membrane protease activity